MIKKLAIVVCITIMALGIPFSATAILIDFEDLSGYEAIGNHYSGVLFDEDWRAFDPTIGNPVYKPFGNMGAGFGDYLSSIYFINAGPTELTIYYTSGAFTNQDYLQLKAYDIDRA